MIDIRALLKTVALVGRHPRRTLALGRRVKRCPVCVRGVLCEQHDAEVAIFAETGVLLPKGVEATVSYGEGDE